MTTSQILNELHFKIKSFLGTDKTEEMLSREKQLPHLVPKGKTGVGSKQRLAQETVLRNASYNTQFQQEAETQQQASVLQANVTIQGKWRRNASPANHIKTPHAGWWTTRASEVLSTHKPLPSAWQTDTAWGSHYAKQIFQSSFTDNKLYRDVKGPVAHRASHLIK